MNFQCFSELHLYTDPLAFMASNSLDKFAEIREVTHIFQVGFTIPGEWKLEFN